MESKGKSRDNQSADIITDIREIIRIREKILEDSLKNGKGHDPILKIIAMKKCSISSLWGKTEKEIKKMVLVAIELARKELDRDRACGFSPSPGYDYLDDDFDYEF